MKTIAIYNIKGGDGNKVSELRIGFDENDKSDE